MIDINKEAEIYASDFIEDKDLIELQVAAFLEGHNSKSTQSKVIQSQIEIIDFVNRLKYTYDYDLNTQQEKIDEKFAYLQQQLKQLENE
jgi:hypothetical protein